MFTVFVPAHINRDSIPTCFVDTKTTFIDVESEQQAVEQQGGSKKPFIVFETDYFTVHNGSLGLRKYDYLSRNIITKWTYYDGHDDQKWNGVYLRNGFNSCREPPVVYFVHKNCIGDLDGSATEDNTIVQYYMESNLKQFAEITKAWEGCCNHCFIIYENSSYQCVDTSNTDNIYTFSESLKDRVVPYVRMGNIATVDFKELDRKIKERQLPRRLLNGEFKLKDEDGHEVFDGEKFTLTFPRYGDDKEEEGEEEDYEPEYDGISIMNETLVSNTGSGDVFSCETIDGILYLTCDNGYLYCPNDGTGAICWSPELPEPSERLQINYDGSHITLTRWGGSVFATYSNESGHPNFIGFYVDEFRLRYHEPLRIRLSMY